jgi:hypothetical protein
LLWGQIWREFRVEVATDRSDKLITIILLHFIVDGD